jgi:hypothetical protein
MRDIDNEPPDVVNNHGVRWWHEVSLTRYAAKEGLASVRVWTIETRDGMRTRVVTEGTDVLADDQTLDGIGVAIDVLAFQRKTK